MGTSSRNNRAHLGGFALSAIVFAATAAVSANVTSAAAEPGTVTANYRISFAGIDIGDFQFKSKVDGNRYDLTSNSRVKLLFGAWKWNSQSTTEGTISRSITPRSFTFNYQIKKKQKSASMRFARGNVVDLVNKPKITYSKEHVPLLESHLKGVLDPMSAIMDMTQIDGEPCRQNLEVFDGQMRFRLNLSPAGKRRIEERKPSGQPNFGYVCKVKFIPIAGYKRESGIKYIANNNGIQIVLRPVPSAKLLVPYQVTVPTMVGSVVLAAQSINIVNGRNQRIAMTH